ncbi:hypothetical protein PHET_10210 [Paragonimus heterotremus]|uniref:Uncharacterized protein n=1 Tax=Paragonimus heterotremus TaxID=100268 RepID=A0A8J4T249_9TREM|nr:hypothetical protein PHET_10210 [Paragonimus heterotremus]
MCFEQTSGEKSSLFDIPHQCFKLVKNEVDDLSVHPMTEDWLKCLMSLSSLRSSADADIRTRIMNKIELDLEVNLRRLFNLKHHTNTIEYAQKRPEKTIGICNADDAARKIKLHRIGPVQTNTFEVS